MVYWSAGSHSPAALVAQTPSSRPIYEGEHCAVGLAKHNAAKRSTAKHSKALQSKAEQNKS